MTTFINYVDPTIHGSVIPSTYVPPGALQALGVPAGGSVGASGANYEAVIVASSLGSSTYVGDTALIIPANVAYEPEETLSGYFTNTSGSTTFVCVIPVGFQPTHINILDFDGASTLGYEWFRGMPAADEIKYTFGTGVAVTTSSIAVVPSEPSGAGPAGNWIVTFTATLAAAGDTIIFRIEA